MIEWYNENSLRKYPFNEEASLCGRNGNILPNNVIVDCRLTVTNDYQDIYMPHIRITPHSISLTIAATGSGLFAGTYSIADIKPYTAYQLDALMPNISGWVVFGDYTGAKTEIYQFNDVKDSGLAFNTIFTIARPNIPDIYKLGLANTHRVRGLVKLKAGSGIRVFKHEIEDNVIVVEATNPERFVGPCNPAVDRVGGRKSLHNINNVVPDSAGVITIRFDE